MSRKESALDLAKFVDKGVRVKLAGGREGGPPARACRVRGVTVPVGRAEFEMCHSQWKES